VNCAIRPPSPSARRQIRPRFPASKFLSITPRLSGA
jgi:hypothetical protein